MNSMDPMRESLREDCVLNFSITTQPEQWASGLDGLCAALEVEFPSQQPLIHGLVGRKVVRLKDRRSHLDAVARTPFRDLLIRNSLDRKASISIRGVLNDRARLAFDFQVFTPASSWEERARLLQVCGDAAGVYAGGFTPLFSANALYAYANLARSGGAHINAAPVVAALAQTGEVLPSLRPVATGGARFDSAQPDQLHWVNYWSAATCKFLDFPDAERDGEWLRLAEQTPADAWVVRLTDEPFDVRSSTHIGVLARAYRRFAGVGIRSAG